jgi:chromosome segregation protein
MAEQIAKLEVETSDLQVEFQRASGERAAAEESLARARGAMEALALERVTSESQLAGARAQRDALAQELRVRERDLAAIVARLESLEELEAARAQYGDGARTILAESPAGVEQMGSVADFLEVDHQYERAVEACCGELLQYVVVPSHAHAAAGLEFARARGAGRVGFIVSAGFDDQASAVDHVGRPGLIALGDVARASGPAKQAIRSALSGAWIAPDFDTARVASLTTVAPVVTLAGEVFRGAHVVEGGLPAEARGILATKREIKDLRVRSDEQHAAIGRLRDDMTSVELTIAGTESVIASVHGELHRQEKAVVAYELQMASASDAVERIQRKQGQLSTERRSADEERRLQEARQDEARVSIARLETDQRAADDELNRAQRRLFDAREAIQAQSNRTAEAKAAHAALVERAAALASEVQRLAEAGAELEARVAARREDQGRTDARRAELEKSVVDSEARLDADIRALDDLRDGVRRADERSQALRAEHDEQDGRIREARRALEGIRAETAQLDIARATAEADLTHLASSSVETVQATLDEIAAEVAQLERDGVLASAKAIDDAPDAAELDEEAPTEPAAASAEAFAAARSLTPEEMVADLRDKIERIGAVNMMAIDQFDDLESRHGFLTAQRKDLVDSIAATGDAIKKIDKTTKERFREAFAVINHNFEQTFATLFGGGRAGLVLLDDTDQLESGIDIHAQPPGKRLQNVQLLSGGEKALTAMALMFAIFKYRPSPFCLLDEIDAPLDDANIGRFVEMLQGMQEDTQFILITHNRKTMEIADRLWGVTMEEPGVSKLISVQLN